MVTPWKKPTKRPLFMLAPMEAVTDTVFRQVVTHAAKPDLLFTEFVSTDGYASSKGRHSTRGRLIVSPNENSVIAQIWGNNPQHFSLMARNLAQQNFVGIDINMGCPDKAVVKQGSGSALITQPELSAQIIDATKQGGLPVSVKTRLGNVRVDEWENWLEHLLKQDLANLTIHLRTRKEMSKVEAHFELIPQIIALRDTVAPQTLITLNGDIKDYKHGMALYKQHAIDGIMIGRGIFANPYAFSATSHQPTQAELLDLLRLHLDLHDQYDTQKTPRKFDPLKRFFKIYIKDFPGASVLRHALMQIKNTQEARDLIDDFFIKAEKD